MAPFNEGESKTAAETATRLLERSRELPEDQSDIVHTFDDGWTLRKLRTVGDHWRESELMSNCTDDAIRAHIGETESEEPDWVVKQRIENYALDRPWEELDSNYISLRDPNNIPHVTIGGEDMEAWGRHNDAIKVKYYKYLQGYKYASYDAHDIRDGEPQNLRSQNPEPWSDVAQPSMADGKPLIIRSRPGGGKQPGTSGGGYPGQNWSVRPTSQSPEDVNLGQVTGRSIRQAKLLRQIIIAAKRGELNDWWSKAIKFIEKGNHGHNMWVQLDNMIRVFHGPCQCGWSIERSTPHHYPKGKNAYNFRDAIGDWVNYLDLPREMFGQLAGKPQKKKRRDDDEQPVDEERAITVQEIEDAREHLRSAHGWNSETEPDLRIEDLSSNSEAVDWHSQLYPDCNIKVARRISLTKVAVANWKRVVLGKRWRHTENDGFEMWETTEDPNKFAIIENDDEYDLYALQGSFDSPEEAKAATEKFGSGWKRVSTNCVFCRQPWDEASKGCILWQGHEPKDRPRTSDDLQEQCSHGDRTSCDWHDIRSFGDVYLLPIHNHGMRREPYDRLETFITTDPQGPHFKKAMLLDWHRDSRSDLSFEEWMNTPVEIYRAGDPRGKAWTANREVADTFSKKETDSDSFIRERREKPLQIHTRVVRPIDVFGYSNAQGEHEVMFNDINTKTAQDGGGGGGAGGGAGGGGGASGGSGGASGGSGGDGGGGDGGGAGDGGASSGDGASTDGGASDGATDGSITDGGTLGDTDEAPQPPSEPKPSFGPATNTSGEMQCPRCQENCYSIGPNYYNCMFCGWFGYAYPRKKRRKREAAQWKPHKILPPVVRRENSIIPKGALQRLFDELPMHVVVDDDGKSIDHWYPASFDICVPKLRLGDYSTLSYSTHALDYAPPTSGLGVDGMLHKDENIISVNPLTSVHHGGKRIQPHVQVNLQGGLESPGASSRSSRGTDFLRDWLNDLLDNGYDEDKTREFVQQIANSSDIFSNICGIDLSFTNEDGTSERHRALAPHPDEENTHSMEDEFQYHSDAHWHRYNDALNPLPHDEWHRPDSGVNKCWIPCPEAKNGLTPEDYHDSDDYCNRCDCNGEVFE